MVNTIYVGLSAQKALQERLDTIANNVANTNTPGFRSEEVKFQTLVSQSSVSSISYASSGESFLSRRSGAVVHTGNPLDIAVAGNAWLSIQTPNGQTYTRDGRLQISHTGALQSVAGHALLDVGGTPIQLNAKAGPITISDQGSISQNGKVVAKIGLFALPKDAKLSRAADASVQTNKPAVPIVDFTNVSVKQGYVEKSNVNPVLEMARLVDVSRRFEAVSQAMSDLESQLKEAIRKIGSNG